MTSLETISGYYPYLYVRNFNRNITETQNYFGMRYNLTEWDLIKPGDWILVVGEPDSEGNRRYAGYHGKWQESLTEGDWGDDPEMTHHRVYLLDPTSSFPVLDAIKQIELKLPDLAFRLALWFGFENGNIDFLTEYIETEIKYYPDLFYPLQCLYSSI